MNKSRLDFQLKISLGIWLILFWVSKISSFNKLENLFLFSRSSNNTFSGETEYNIDTGKYKPKYNDYAQYLTSITLPNSIETIGLNAFYATPLTQIVLLDSVVDIGDGAFENCKNLESVKLSKNTKYIGIYTFANTTITSIEIPNSVNYIHNKAFRNTKLSGELFISLIQ